MSDEAAAAAPPPGPGSIVWTDLTVPDADPVRDFYRAVVGWETESGRWAATPTTRCGRPAPPAPSQASATAEA